MSLDLIYVKEKEMKKLAVLFLAVMMLFAFYSCDPSSGGNRMDGVPGWLAGKTWKGEVTEKMTMPGSGPQVQTVPYEVTFKNGEIPVSLDEIPEWASVSAVADGDSYVLTMSGTGDIKDEETGLMISVTVEAKTTYKRIDDSTCFLTSYEKMILPGDITMVYEQSGELKVAEPTV